MLAHLELRCLWNSRPACYLMSRKGRPCPTTSRSIREDTSVWNHWPWLCLSFSTHKQRCFLQRNTSLSLMFSLILLSQFICFYCPTHPQLSLLCEVRSLVASHDLELYDRLVLTREREAHQAWQGGLGVFHPPGHCNHAASVIQTTGNSILPLVDLCYFLFISLLGNVTIITFVLTV